MANPNNLPLLRENPSIRVGVQRTTFSVDVSARFICNTWDEATSNVVSRDIQQMSGAFDAVVIGSGMYGAFCAEKIWRRGGKVLVLEAGPFLVSEHTQNLANLGLFSPGPVLPEDPSAQQPRNQVWGVSWRGNQSTPGQAYCVGGKSLFWGGWSPRLTDDVLDFYPAGARAYLKKNYEDMEVQLGVRELKRDADGNLTTNTEIGTDFINDTGKGNLTAVLTQKVKDRFGSVKVGGKSVLQEPQKAPVAVQGQAPASGLFSFDKFSSLPVLADAIREDIGRSNDDDANRRLFLVPNCHVNRLDAANGTVQRINVFVDNAFKSLEIPPTCNVILAMSCIDSTRLALESFPTPEMGRNLMVHVRSNFAVRIPRAKFPGLKTGAVETAAVHVPGISTGGGRFHFQIVGGANRDDNAEAIWFRTIPDTEMLQGILNNQDSDFVSLVFRSIGEMFGVKDNGSPDPTVSWIDLSPFERDEFGMRRAYINLKLTPLDEVLWNEMDDAMFELAKALGDGETQFWHKGQWVKEFPKEARRKLASEPENGPRDGLGTTYHECGTLWMGEPPFPSVTDFTGKFRHISNSYCIDQSVFTRSGSANPVLTGVTLARQTADVVGPQPPDGSIPEAGFTPLFTFKTPGQLLPDGWEHFGGGNFHRWKGIMETVGGIGLLAYTKKQFTDLVLRLQWRSFTIRNNSGVYVRLPQTDGNFDFKKGYEIQIDNIGNRPGDASAFPEENFNPFHQTGAVYPVHGVSNPPSPNGRPSIKPIPTKTLGEWNDYEITVAGNRIKVVLNGTEVLEGGDYSDNNNTYPKGFIALQNHFKGARVQFRNVRIKEL